MSKITTKMKRHVRHELKEEGPTIWVGKEGLTSAVMVQLEKQLQKNKMVKARILKTALEDTTAKAIAEQAATQTDSALVEVRGHVFILFRKRRKPEPEQDTPKP
ncbi:MAG: YhbY family RNA-binding protein [Candidatus Bathyarchaeota archaeon]|nr:YhbY family RNA-binding protein [Candidatus Bathyarchaeota archaeon]